LSFSGFFATMSHSSERDEGSSSLLGIDTEDSSVVGTLRDWIEIPVLLVIVAGMLWIRLRSYSNFLRDGQVYFSGNDAWYHLREVRYVVRHWPFTMPFDPWTNFPTGTFVGQFGTLYDQIVATVALIVGLGSPSPDLVAKILLVSPAVAGALTAIPTYLLGKRLAGRIAGLFSAFVLLLLPGTFLQRTLVGFADHNGVEPLFQAFAVLAMMVALAVGQRERPIWELVVARDWDAFEATAKWSVLAGFAFGLYLWVWPPGVLLLGIFAVYMVLQVLSDYAGGRSPDHIAFVATVSMVTTAVMSLVKLQEVTLTPTKLGLLQPGFALVIAASAVGMAWLARWFDETEFDDEWLAESGFPTTVILGVLVSVLLVVTLDVQPFNSIRTNLLRFVGFSTGAATRTIGEAQPWLDSGLARAYGEFGVIVSEYGVAFFTAVVGAVWLLAKPLYRRNDDGDRQFLGLVAAVVVFIFLGNLGGVPDIFGGLVGLFGISGEIGGLVVVTTLLFAAAARIRYDAEHLFVFVWAAFLTMAAFTQVRFNYYLAVAVAVFNAYFIREVLTIVDIDIGANIEAPEVETYQVITAVLVVMVVLVPVLTVPLTLGPRDASTQTAYDSASETRPGGVVVWDDSLQWLQGNTPEEGTFGGADNEMKFYGQFDRPADGNYDYPEGAYGVQSWWDYGHWITMRGERIPNANPFQEGATSAANFLLAPNESAANSRLADQGEEGDQTRYVMVDWQMVSPTAGNAKFRAPIQFYDAGNVSQRTFFTQRTIEGQTFDKQVLVRGQRGFQGVFTERKQRYYDSMVVRLYKYHGSRAEPTVDTLFGSRVIVFDYREIDAQGTSYKVVPTGENQSAIKTFANMSAAKSFVEEDGSARIGGVGDIPRETVPALEHYRLVDTADATALSQRSYRAQLLRTARTLGIQPRFLLKSTPKWVKTFEKVPGATVRGTGASPNETITATVQMKLPAPSGGNATTFEYRQQTTADENGNFTLTLPYSTTDYDEYGPDNGYTNVSVRSVGAYTISGEVESNESAYLLRNAAQLNVSEGDVNGDEDGVVTVELDEEVLQEPEGVTANESSENESSGNESLRTGSVSSPPVSESFGSNTQGSLSDVSNASESVAVTAATRTVTAREVAGPVATLPGVTA
jgi:dolichyl-diphosphooligosaccharide--protein glycosyltransferase